MASLPYSDVMASLPTWKRTIVKQRGAAWQAENAMRKEQRRRAAETAEKVARLKARIQREKHATAKTESAYQVSEQRRQNAKELNLENRRLLGHDVTARLMELPTPSPEEVQKLSVLCNRQLVRHYPPQQRSFQQLFRAVGVDGSHRITFVELQRLVRGPLHLSGELLPPARMAVLWKALDANNNGIVDSGEIARFLRLGQQRHTGIEVARESRERMFGRAKDEAAAARAQRELLQERGIATQAAAVEPASAEEVVSYGRMFRRQLGSKDINTNVHSLFKQTDLDGSGQVTFSEFERMARRELRLSTNALPSAKLLSLWRAIDINGNGFIDAGEFGRFLRDSIDKGHLQTVTERHIRERFEQASGEGSLPRIDSSSRAAAMAAAKQAQAMEAEADALAARLQALMASGVSTRSRIELPTSKYEIRKMHSTANLQTSGGEQSGSPVRRVRKIKSEPRLAKHGGGGGGSNVAKPALQPAGGFASRTGGEGEAWLDEEAVSEALHKLAREVGALGGQAAASMSREASRGQPIAAPLSRDAARSDGGARSPIRSDGARSRVATPGAEPGVLFEQGEAP